MPLPALPAMAALATTAAPAAAPAAAAAAPGFMGALQGLTSNPQALTDLLGNPMFTSGMGLLSAGQNPNVDPYQAILQGLSTAQSYNVGKEKRESAKQLKMDNKKLSEALAALIGQQKGPAGSVLGAQGGAAKTTAGGGGLRSQGGVPGGGATHVTPRFQSPTAQSIWDNLGWAGPTGR